MKKTIIIILVLAVGIYAVYALANRGDGVTNGLSEYFGERLTTVGFGEGAPMPIEGYDAQLLMSAFPGLVPQDFDGVKALEGVYEFRNGELVFERDFEMPVSSAERTVAPEGYGALLKNVSERLGTNIEDELDVDSLLDTINTSDVIGMGLGGSASAFGLNITPTRILEDSRCPVDVNCIQAGTVRLETIVSDPNGESTKVFTLGQATTTSNYGVTLSRVGPERESATTTPADEEYIFYFDVVRR